MRIHCSKQAPSDEVVTLDSRQVMLLLPHRHPFLLVDRVVALVRGRYIHGIKNIAITEPFFQGHLPNRPVMPGVLLMEALAQACGILALESARVILQPGSRFYLVGIDEGRFRKPVLPGDQVVLKANLQPFLFNSCSFCQSWQQIFKHDLSSLQIVQSRIQ